jgi:hypothetical protein
VTIFNQALSGIVYEFIFGVGLAYSIVRVFIELQFFLVIFQKAANVSIAALPRPHCGDGMATATTSAMPVACITR